MLSFKEQNCNITLREGIEEYNSYLVANGKEILTELSDSSIVMDHDATHVIFGLDTSLEEESLLDSWVLWCSSFELKYLMSYSKQPEIKDLYKKLLREVGILKFIKLFFSVFPTKLRIIFKHKKTYDILLEQQFGSQIKGLKLNRKFLLDLDESTCAEIIRYWIKKNNVAMPNKKILGEILKAFIYSNPSAITRVNWSRADNDQKKAFLTFSDGDLVLNEK